jgi:ribosomal protein S18 acetylase RimI-like enzyme
MRVAHDIRVMTLDDVAPVAEGLARAFYDDPLQEWALPDGTTRLEQLERIFALLARHVSVPLGESYTDRNRSCAAFWVPPDRPPISPEAARALAELSALPAETVRRLQTADASMRARRPSEPHFYLQGLGTDPARQGEGLGSAAVGPVLSRCDSARVPAYLESTKERNVRFYEALGFAVVDTIDIPLDGPRLWAMWREPQPARAE